MQKDPVKIVQEYEQQCALYLDFTEKNEKLIEDLLKEKNIKVHSISSRLKKSENFKKKFELKEGKYLKLSDITDISGIRIITYFADDVDAVAKVIEEEFNIDRENSVDKRAFLDPDRFGYISLHYVAKLSNSRLQLTELRRFSDCKVEIQVRSILQHTWAEIEHDLGYKSKDSVPKDIRRRFSRLAGLLELADSEFIQIRDSLQEYEKAIPGIITKTPESALIDQASLNAFIENSTLVQELDQRIATAAKSKIIERKSYDTINEIKYFGFKNIAEIESALRRFGDIVVQFAGKWITVEKYKELQPGISLFYLCYILAAHNSSDKEVLDYLKITKIGIESQESIAKKVMSIYNEVSPNK